MSELFKVLCGACLLAVIFSQATAAERPNIVMILTDDQGWGDLSLHGNTNLSTPHLDAIAREGAQFERFYVQPVCAPTRAEMLTGRYHPRAGVLGVSRGQERMNPEERTLAEILQESGYATGLFGKWHNGTQHPYHPNSQGFDAFYGFASGHWGHYFDPLLEHNGEAVRGEGFIIDDLTAKALNFIEARKEEPFFCFLSYNTPHSPFQAPDEYWDRFADKPIDMRHNDAEREEIEKTRAALAMVENIDWNVGRVLDALETLDLAESTIVVFFTDNGPNSFRWNGGMRGIKGTTDEGGVRVPCFVRWPGKIPAGRTIGGIAGAIDLLPTLTELVGLAPVATLPLDGISVASALLEGAALPEDRLIFSTRGVGVSVRNARFHLDANGKLYDLQSDPGQQRPVNESHPEMAETLKIAVKTWREELLPNSPEDRRPFVVGYGDWPNTVLPARDGNEHGGIERSGRAPNCSYFTHWTSLDGYITWDVRVAQAGDYEAIVYYTCAEENLGAVVELAFNEASVAAVVDRAHDMPAYGMEADRVERGTESYVKDFLPLSLGKITLPAQTGALTLRAREMPGDALIEVRGLVLRRVEGRGHEALNPNLRPRSPLCVPVFRSAARQ